MRIAIELSAPQEALLRDRARVLGIAPEELARAAVADLLGHVGDDFTAAADHILRKNADLYARLAR